MLTLKPTLTLKPISILKPTPPIPTSASSAIQLAIIKTACSWAYSSKNQPLLDKLEFLKGINLDKVQIFKIMLWDKIKEQYNKWPKSSHKMFINILLKDIKNNPNLVYIREINYNRIQERYCFNALIKPILTNKELKNKYKDKDKHKDKVKEVKQKVNHLKDVREAYINLIL